MRVEVEQLSGAALLLAVDTLTDEDATVMRRWLSLTQHLWGGWVDGRLACAWGLVPPTLIADCAHLWLYTTPAMEPHKFLLVRKSQVAIAEMLRLYPTITGYTLRENLPAQRWIKWLGGVYGKPDGKFIPFEIRSRAWQPQEYSAQQV